MDSDHDLYCLITGESGFMRIYTCDIAEMFRFERGFKVVAEAIPYGEALALARINNIKFKEML